ncbi:hypothetical protein L2E82_36425 [Cichorium intybus]|uniref:Uncharacterized protein n=1 Tax=Cichorium intybus TaxID=13427 RepID=A0ACB9BRM5_CICIN|nr:hypothetical protein L2E82_36425 [Cichorium intybus]
MEAAVTALAESIRDVVRPCVADFEALLFNLLQEKTSNSDRATALNAVEFFIKFTQDASKVIKYWEFILNILKLSRQCLALAKVIVQFSLEVYSSIKLDSSTHHQAIQIIPGYAKYKISSIKKHKLVILILQATCPLITKETGILNALDSDEVNKRHYYASSVFCENMGEEFIFFLGSWRSHLQHNKHFLYMLKSFMVLPNDGDLHPGERATNLVGMNAMVIGRDVVLPAISSFNLDDGLAADHDDGNVNGSDGVSTDEEAQDEPGEFGKDYDSDHPEDSDDSDDSEVSRIKDNKQG